MSKINRIKIENLKAIGEFEASFNGCTGIVTAGNNKGKTTFLRSLPDRIRGIKPSVVVKEGEEKGKGIMELNTGERFEWEFDVEGKDTLSFYTKEGYKTKVTKEISAKFFPPLFDIDKFLQSQPKEQSKQLQKIIGIDFTDIDNRYAVAYNNRTEKNRDAERFHAKLIEMLEVPKVEPVDLTKLQERKEAERKRLNDLYLNNKSQNDTARSEWNNKCRAIDVETKSKNDENERRATIANECINATSILKKHGFTDNSINVFVAKISEGILNEDINPADLYPKEPEYITELPDNAALQVIDDEILQASITNQKAAEYKNYIDYKSSVESAKDIAKEADELVKAIEAERAALILSANMPLGIAITPDGITVDGFPLDRSQISTSKLYTAALRIASMNLGDVKTLYFDASFLDRQSLSEIELWAVENDLQLLIERPEYDGGELKYEIVEESVSKAA